MTDPRYRYSGRRSPPLFNPARASMPAAPVGYNSLFGGDIHVEPTSRQYDYHASSVTPVTTTTYTVRKDPVARAPVRGQGSLRRRVSTTADSTSKRPIIVTTKVATSSSSGSNPPRSPSRDTYRSNDDGGPAYYAQPASSIKRTRITTHALPPPSESTADNRLLLLGPRSSEKHYHQRGVVRSPAFYNGPSQRHESSEYGDHGYEYTKPSDLARYDLAHQRPRRLPSRRESFDKHYHRERGVYEMPDKRLRGPPPTTWGLHKINANVRPPSAGSASGLRMPPAPDPIRRSDTASAGPLVLVDSPSSTPRRGPSRNRDRDGPGRPVSVYRDDHYRSHDDGAGTRESRDRGSKDRGSRDRDPRDRGPRDRDRRDHESRDREPKESRDREPREVKEREPREAKDREYFHDDKVPSRGFGLRVEPSQDDVYRRGAESRHRDERRERRYHNDREPRRRSDDDQGSRRDYDDRERKQVRDSRADDDGERERRRAERREDVSPPLEKERVKGKEDRDSKKDSLKETLATGLGLAAASLGIGSAFKGSDKDSREREKEREKERTKDGNDEKHDKQPARRRQEDDAGRRNRPVDDERFNRREETEKDSGRRNRPVDEERFSRREENDEDRDRPRRERARSDVDFDTGGRNRSPDKYLLTDDGAKSASRRRPGRAVTPFDPNDTAGLMALKEKLATTEEPEMEKVRVNQREPVKEKVMARPRSGSMPSAYRSSSPERKTSPVRSAVEVSSEPTAPSTVLGQRAEDSPPPLTSSLSTRGRELMPTGEGEKERQVRVVSPLRGDRDGDKDLDDSRRPIKGILKPPTSKFPEDQNPLREGVAPHKDDPKAKSGVPSGARWTKINRRMVNPEALTLGKERFEVRDDFVIVLRVLSKEEIQAYAAVTAELRERRKKEPERKEKEDDDDDEDPKRDGQWSRQRDEERDLNDERDRRDRDRDRADRDRDEKGKEKEKERGDRDRGETDRERGSRRYKRYGSDEDDDGYYEPRSGQNRDRRDRGHDRDPRDAMGGSE